MAVDMFLKIDGIKGESQDKDHPGEIDVLAWSFGATNSGSAHSGSGAGAGKVNVHDLSFTKNIDKSSPDLFLHCCNGKHFTKALLTVRKAGGTPIEYLKINLEHILIAAYHTGGAGGEDKLTENITLNFSKFNFDYTEQTADGKEGAKPKMGWDIAANAKR